jgi:YqaJ-like viral recombinase domain
MIEVIKCEQGSPEWLHARLGLATASEFSSIMASGRGGGASKTRRSYLLRLAGEIITGEPAETFVNHHMERGKAMEEEARELYAFMCDFDPELVGFVKNGRAGCSPDSLVGLSGMLEIKTKQPHLAIECLLQEIFPAEHKAQCQGALWVAERQWIDLVVYWPKLPLYVCRAYRDEAYISQLGDALAAFNEELDFVVSRVRSRAIWDRSPAQKLLLPEAAYA